MSNNLLIVLIVFMFVLCCAGVIGTKPKDRIIYEQEQQINSLRIEIRDLKLAEPWLLLMHTNLPEIRQLELDCAAEAIKQKSERDARK